MLFKRVAVTTKSQKVIRLMQRNSGASNSELSKIMLRYSSLVHKLRKSGHRIYTVRVKNGYYKYYMEVTK